MSSTKLALVAVLGVACSERPRPAPAGLPPAPVPVPRSPADSLVLRLEGETSIWLVEGRSATDSSGATCYERSVEIRRAATNIRVPLLYTLSPIRPAGAGFVLAVLSTNCRPLGDYRVELATGRPTKVRDR